MKGPKAVGKQLTVDEVRNHNTDSHLGLFVNPRTRQIKSLLTMIWNKPVIRPRTSFGEHSETYAGDTAEMAPIPMPDMTRPA